MIPMKDLLKITGYIKGGCSPVGMKKSFKTFLHSSSVNQDTIMVSGGKQGLQIELSPGFAGSRFIRCHLSLSRGLWISRGGRKRPLCLG
jgi:Cys-tRNA(Pro) deacylase